MKKVTQENIKIAAYAPELRSIGYTGTAKIQAERFANFPLPIQKELALFAFQKGEVYYCEQTKSFFLERGNDICEQNVILFGDSFFYPITHHNFDYDMLDSLRHGKVVEVYLEFDKD